MSIEQLPALQIMVTLVAAPICVMIRNPRGAWACAMAANAFAFVNALLLLGQVLDTGVIRYAVGGWAAPSGIEYYIDALNAAMLVLISGISAVVLLYAYRSVGKVVPLGKQYLFYSAWMMCVTGLMGIVITGDAFNVFVFLEISSLAMYTLISFGQDRRALTASFRYLVLGSVGASFILIGIGFLYAATGTLNMVDLAGRIPDSESQRAVLVAFSFITMGVLIKSAVFPLHAWLPDAYTYAPIAATAFLAGTATKVSLYILLRFFFSIFGKDYSFGQHLLTGVLLPAAVAGFLLMSLVAMFQTDLRRMLAYSSVAQIGYMVAGFSLATQTGLTAGIVHVINHAMVKTSLFMAVGCISVSGWSYTYAFAGQPDETHAIHVRGIHHLWPGAYRCTVDCRLCQQIHLDRGGYGKGLVGHCCPGTAQFSDGGDLHRQSHRSHAVSSVTRSRYRIVRYA